MLEQVRRDHGEARLSLVDDDLAAVVRSVAEQFEALAAERDIRARRRDARRARLALRPRAHEPRRLQPARQRAALRRRRRRGPRARSPRTARRRGSRSPTAASACRPSSAQVLFERFRTADNGQGRTRHGPRAGDREGVRRSCTAAPSRSARRPRAARCSPCACRASRPPPSPRRRGCRSSSPPPAARATSRSTWPPSCPARRRRRWRSSGCRRCCSWTATASAPAVAGRRARAPRRRSSRPPRPPRRCAWPPTCSRTWS